MQWKRIPKRKQICDQKSILKMRSKMQAETQEKAHSKRKQKRKQKTQANNAIFQVDFESTSLKKASTENKLVRFSDTFTLFIRELFRNLIEWST